MESTQLFLLISNNSFLPKRLKIRISVTLFFGKVLLTGTAEGANPILGQVFKIGIRLDTVVGISYLGLILIATKLAHMNDHFQILLSVNKTVISYMILIFLSIESFPAPSLSPFLLFFFKK